MPTQQQVLEATSPCPAADLSEQQDEQDQPPLLLNDISPELQRRIDLIDAVMQAPRGKARSDAIQKAAQELGRTPRTIRMMVKRVENGEGPAMLAVGRKDKDQFRISEQWFKFIIATYEWGQEDGSRMNQHQVHRKLVTLASEGEKLRDKKYAQKFKGYPEVLEEMVAGECISHVTVYKVLKLYLKQKNKSNLMIRVKKF